MPKPADWPDGLDYPAFYRTGAAPGARPVQLADGRWTADKLDIRVTTRDEVNTVIEMRVEVKDGRIQEPTEVRITADRIPWSALRHHKLREHAEMGIAQFTAKPDESGDLVMQWLTSESRASVRTALRRRKTPELLEQVATIYRAAGGGADGIRAVAAELSYDPRHARRLRDDAIEAGKLRQDER